jgi:hypothetical protein
MPSSPIPAKATVVEVGSTATASGEAAVRPLLDADHDAPAVVVTYTPWAYVPTNTCPDVDGSTPSFGMRVAPGVDAIVDHDPAALSVRAR